MYANRLNDALEASGIESTPVIEQQVCEDTAPPGDYIYGHGGAHGHRDVL